MENKATKIIVKSDAKCIHCKFFTRGNYIKEDGTESKRILHFCNNASSKLDHQVVSLKHTACDKFELQD